MPLACSAAMATRTGPHAFFIISRYSSGRSRPSLSTARLITWKFTSMSRTFSTSRIQRDVIQHHGHSGSNQKPATSFLAINEILSNRRCGRTPLQHNHRRPSCVPAVSDLVLTGVALPNLTRDQAAERAALVTVDSYRIVLDLTDGGGKPGERTFRSVTTVEFDALAGADTFIDIVADTDPQRHAQRRRRSTCPATTSPPASR